MEQGYVSVVEATYEAAVEVAPDDVLAIRILSFQAPQGHPHTSPAAEIFCAAE